MTLVQADSGKRGQSLTHIKTTPGLASALEGAGVVIYKQDGATEGTKTTCTDVKLVIASEIGSPLTCYSALRQDLCQMIKYGVK